MDGIAGQCIILQCVGQFRAKVARLHSVAEACAQGWVHFGWIFCYFSEVLPQRLNMCFLGKSIKSKLGHMFLKRHCETVLHRDTVSCSSRFGDCFSGSCYLRILLAWAKWQL